MLIRTKENRRRKIMRVKGECYEWHFVGKYHSCPESMNATSKKLGSACGVVLKNAVRASVTSTRHKIMFLQTDVSRIRGLA